MSAGLYNLYIEQGATLSKDCFYQDSNGDPVDLTGMSLEAQIRQTYSDVDILQAILCTIADQSIPANLGKFNISLTSAETAALPVNSAVNFEGTPTNYTWDINLDTGSTIIRLMQGAVIVSPGVTR